MFWSKFFTPTLRGNSNSTILERAGYLHAGSDGADTLLPLAERSISRMRNILRSEIQSAPSVRDAWRRFFSHCEIQTLEVECGSGSAAFMTLTLRGEQSIAICRACGYAGCLSTAQSVPVPPERPDENIDAAPEEFRTPGIKTISALAEFTGLPRTSHIKSLVRKANNELLLILIRGDHQLSEAKLAQFLEMLHTGSANAEEITRWFGAEPGSLGPVGVAMRILADRALESRKDMTAGANRTDYHLRHVTPGRDFPAEFADLRAVTEEDRCVSCGARLEITSATELGRPRSDSDALPDFKRTLFWRSRTASGPGWSGPAERNRTV